MSFRNFVRQVFHFCFKFFCSYSSSIFWFFFRFSNFKFLSSRFASNFLVTKFWHCFAGLPSDLRSWKNIRLLDFLQGCQQIQGLEKALSNSIFVSLRLVLFLWVGCLMTSFLPSTGRYLECLLSKAGLMPQFLSSEGSDVHPLTTKAHNSSLDIKSDVR